MREPDFSAFESDLRAKSKRIMTNTRIATRLCKVGVLFGSIIGMEAATAVHDLAADFSISENPASTGWQYSQGMASGGGLVGPFSENWNQGDFGAGQPGWLGVSPPGAH